MNIEYERLEWEDYPSTETPINAENLNHLEEGIAGLYSDRYDMQSNIAYVEDGDTASKDYIPNSYLMRDGLFYKVKKTILYGDSFDSGEDGNIEHVDISSQFGSGGGGSTGCVELTQAQYDALSDEAKMLDVIYLITDSPDNYLDEVFGNFATVEYTDTASKPYDPGDYLVYNNKFYVVTDSIAQDDTITPGTNVEQTTVGDALQSHKLIPDNSDLNDYTIPGTYYVVNAASAQTITNTPMTAAYNLNVEILGADWVHQTARQAGDVVEYERLLNPGSSEWSNWVKRIPRFTQRTYTQSLTVAANATANATINVALSGYVPMAIAAFATNHGSILPQHLMLNYSNHTVVVYVRSVNGASLTTNFQVTVLYVSSGFGL